MDETKLDPELRGAIIAYFEGWELVDFLRVPIDVVVDVLEDYVIDNVDEVEEFIGYNSEDEDDDQGE